MLNSITWNAEPVLFHIGPIELRWYGLLWAMAVFLAWEIVKKIFKHEKHPEAWSEKLFFYGAIGLILGARLGHVLFYEWHLLPEPVTFLGITFKYGNYYLSHPWQIFNVFNGGLSGLASHGGAIGLLIGMYLYNKKVVHKGFIWILDRLVIGVAIGGACIRFGNLMNSEIYGGPTTLPWGFEFVRDPRWSMPLEMGGSGGLPCHPTQIYEMLYCLITFAIIWWMYWKKDAYKKSGLIFGVFLIGIFGTRFLLEFIKFNQEAFEENMFFNMGQLLSIPFIVWGIYLIIHASRMPAISQEAEKPGKKENTNSVIRSASTVVEENKNTASKAKRSKKK
jgi:prolipoprotein diacylglyceryl transferase